MKIADIPDILLIHNLYSVLSPLYTASQAGRQAGLTVGVIIGITVLICLIWVPTYLMCTRVSGCPLFRPYTAKPILNVPPPTTDAPQYEETSFSTTASTQHHVNEGQDEAP